MASNHKAICIEYMSDLFERIGGCNICTYTSDAGIEYISCTRRGLKWIFSVQTCPVYGKGVNEREGQYILRRSDINKDSYLLVTRRFGDIARELELIANHPEHIIVRNKGAVLLQKLKDMHGM
jgi:hypothetical protein